MPHERHHERTSVKVPSRAQAILSNIQKDIRALNASILIISQKMKYLVRNEKILGRNLLVLNKKLKELESAKGGGISEEQLKQIRTELAELSSAIEKNSTAVADIQLGFGQIKENYAKAGELKEIKYIIDSINPLEFVTIKEIDSIIEQKLKGKKKGKK